MAIILTATAIALQMVGTLKADLVGTLLGVQLLSIHTLKYGRAAIVPALGWV